MGKYTEQDTESRAEIGTSKASLLGGQEDSDCPHDHSKMMLVTVVHEGHPVRLCDGAKQDLADLVLEVLVFSKKREAYRGPGQNREDPRVSPENIISESRHQVVDAADELEMGSVRSYLVGGNISSSSKNNNNNISSDNNKAARQEVNNEISDVVLQPAVAGEDAAHLKRTMESATRSISFRANVHNIDYEGSIKMGGGDAIEHQHAETFNGDVQPEKMPFPSPVGTAVEPLFPTTKDRRRRWWWWGWRRSLET